MNLTIGKRMVSWCLVLALVVLMIPAFAFDLSAVRYNETDVLYHFEAGDVAVINQTVIDAIVKGNAKFANFAKEPSFVIEQGVYSVTVQGPIQYNGEDVAVSIIFGTYNEQTKEYEGVTIDRTDEKVSNGTIGTNDSGHTSLQTLYEAGEKLEWRIQNNSYYVPTAPFLITGGAKVNALFLGDCTFRAGLNQAYVNRNRGVCSFGVGNNRCGYAGIQVNRDSSLTIMGVTEGELQVYGGYQLAGNYTGYPANNITNYLDANSTFQGNYIYPTIRINNTNYTADTSHAGGAAIGGGANYNTTSVGFSGYSYGTPGEIIINGGNIYAIGGHLAAAIGGGVNGASTTSKIEINGGNITAVGGRFATAIGDGDSYNGGPANDFLNPAKVIINGGNLQVYGGTSAAAIGTTDEVSHDDKGFGADKFSGLTVEINGGVIEAQSGQATNNNSKTSAIGSGENTNMKDNSITLHSNATVFARSFSEYAISNNGVSNNVPMVNIDPDGFVYMARFRPANYERELTLYPVYKDVRGNPVAVQAPAYDTLRRVEHEKYYAKIEETFNDATVLTLYEVEKIKKTDGSVTFEPVLKDGELVYLNTGETQKDFSYYFDVNSPTTFSVPPNYKAVALSLERGDYVFHVPLKNDDDVTNDVYCHFSKHLSGTTSAQIEDDEANAYHFIYKNMGIQKETPHVIIDETAFGLTEMEIIATTRDEFGDEGTETLLDKDQFQKTVLGYTLYTPNDTKSFRLDFTYSLKDGNKTTQKITFKLKNLETTDGRGDEFDIDATQDDAQQSIGLEFNYDNEEEPVGEIWINKIDTINGSQAFLTYKITVIRKPKHYIHIGALSKKYDGLPVAPEILKITEGRSDDIIQTVEPYYAYDKVLTEYGTHTSVRYPETYDPSQTGDDSIHAQHLQTYLADGKNVTIGYAVIPNETETALSLITRFTYVDGTGDSAKTIYKRTTVNINMDGPELVFTLDDSSDHVLMGSTLGGYKIETAHTKKTENGTEWDVWSIYLVYYDGSLTQEKKDVVLEFKANETAVETTATQLPQLSGDGKPIYPNQEEAKAQALKDAQAAFDSNAWETRYSDSYFYANGKDKIETFTMVVNHPLNKDLKDFTYSIVDTYKDRYHKFHYYAELGTEGEEISFTKEQLAEILAGCSYYADPSGEGILREDMVPLSGPPSDAGNYILKMEYIGEKYEAYSNVAFEIRKRPITIVGVSNWITYLEEKDIKALQKLDQPVHLKTYPSNPLDPATKYNYGTVYFDDVIDGDTVVLSPSIYAYYNEITISHNEKKITLRYDYRNENGQIKGRQIDWLGDLAQEKENGVYLNDNRNYELTGVANFDTDANPSTGGFSFVHVPGMLAYVSKGTIFKKSADGIDKEAIWRKFWPSWSEEFLKWDESADAPVDALGNYTKPHLMEENINYQSPSNASHQDYVYLRTLNANRGKTYSVDIIYGEMIFQYAKAVWDVNTHQYIDTEGTYWEGNNGTNNEITIVNRSDSAITFTATYYKSATWGMLLNVGFSDFYDGTGELTPTKSATLLPAPGAYQQQILLGEEIPVGQENMKSTFYLVVTGRAVNTTKTAIGSITLSISSLTSDDP